MPQFAYASVSVNLPEFMAGKSPTTQPGVQVPYYTSMSAAFDNMEFEFDGKNSASCVMMFDISTVKTKLTPSSNPNILGRGTITPQHVVDAMIQINQSGKNPCFVDAGKCDWKKARETIASMMPEYGAKSDTSQAISEAIKEFAANSLTNYVNFVVNPEQYVGAQLTHNGNRIFTEQLSSTIYRAVRQANIPKTENPLQDAYKTLQVAYQAVQNYAQSAVSGLVNPQQDEFGAVPPPEIWDIAPRAYVATAAISNLNSVLSPHDAYMQACLQFMPMPEFVQNTGLKVFDEAFRQIANQSNTISIDDQTAVALAAAWNAVMPAIQNTYPEYQNDAMRYREQNAQYVGSDTQLKFMLYINPQRNIMRPMLNQYVWKLEYEDTTQSITMAQEIEKVAMETYQNNQPFNTEAEKIQAALQAGYNAGMRLAEENDWSLYIDNPSDFYQELTQDPESIGNESWFIQEGINIYAELNFAYMPPEVHGIAMTTFNVKMQEFSTKDDFIQNLAKYTKHAVAETFKELLPQLQAKYPEYVKAATELMRNAEKAPIYELYETPPGGSLPGAGDMGDDFGETP
ncbi:MAG: hypothetical protein IJZ68_06465 [Bacteroidaceae bacterium]|nr:hypothetical protein [Bacteroidaceae bacterium]